MANLRPLNKTISLVLSQLERLSSQASSAWASALDVSPAIGQQVLDMLEQQQIIQRTLQRIQLHPQSPVVMGFDLGGTKVKGRLAALDGRILARTVQVTRKGDETAALAQMGQLAGDMLQQGGVDPRRLQHVAIGIPGAIDKQGNVNLSPNLNLPSRLPAVFTLAGGRHCPVTFENDVNLAALGEYHQGHGQNSDSLVFIAFGTGVGMGIIIQDHIISGHGGMAGEISLLPLSATPYEDAPVSACGIFEDRVGSHAIRQRYLRGDTAVIDIFRQAERGDAQAIEAMETTARIAALGVAAAASLLNPEWLILGGGIGARPAFYQQIQHFVHQLLPMPVQLTGSALGDDAGVIGAVYLAHQHCLDTIVHADSERIPV